MEEKRGSRAGERELEEGGERKYRKREGVGEEGRDEGREKMDVC